MPTLACVLRCALCALSLVALVGCPDAPPPKAFSDIDVSLATGLFSRDLNLTNKHIKRLNCIDVTLTIYTETEVKTLERHWSEWLSGEMKVVNVSAAGGPLQRLTVTGTATLGVEETPVTINEEFSWIPKRAP